jgi:hypothetical protein
MFDDNDLTQDEIDEWAEGKTLEEIGNAWNKDATHLRESLGISLDDVPRDARGVITGSAVEDTIVSKLEEVNAQRQAEEAAEAERQERAEARAREEEGFACQRRFLERHPEFVPSLEAGNKLRDACLAMGMTEWNDVDLEAAYSNLLVEQLESR